MKMVFRFGHSSHSPAQQYVQTLLPQRMQNPCVGRGIRITMSISMGGNFAFVQTEVNEKSERERD